MNKDMESRVLAAIESKGLSPEKTAQAKALFSVLSKVKPEEVAPISGGVDYFKLTAALCAAAMCVGKSPTALSFSEIRTNALGVAKAIFTEDGEIIPNSYKK